MYKKILSSIILVSITSIHVWAEEADMPIQVIGDGNAASCTQTALEAALLQGGHIKFNCGGTFQQEVTIPITKELLITKHTILDGKDGEASVSVILDGLEQTRILHKTTGANLTVQSITLKNGRAPTEGVHFSEQSGGAILATGAGTELKINSTSFVNNSVAQNNSDSVAGGAVYAFEIETLNISSSSFNGNTASNGGAVGSSAHKTYINSSSFNNNHALGTGQSLQGIGGAIYINDSATLTDLNRVVEINSSSFIENSAVSQGGAVAILTQSTVSINSSSFLDNRVNNVELGTGGALVALESTVTVNSSSFVNNYAGQQGGAIYLGENENITLRSSSFVNNEVDKDWLAYQAEQQNTETAAPSDETNLSTFSAVAVTNHDINNLTLSVNFTPDHENNEQEGVIYIAAQLGEAYYFYDGEVWLPMTQGIFPSYYQGTLTAMKLPILKGIDISALIGTVVYVGYGRDQGDMLDNNQITAVYTVQ